MSGQCDGFYGCVSHKYDHWDRRLHNIHWGCVSGFIISSTAVFIHRGSRCTDRPRGHYSCKSSSYSLNSCISHFCAVFYIQLLRTAGEKLPIRSEHTAVRRVLVTLKHKHTHEACDVIVLNMWPDPSHLHPLQTDSSGHIPDPHLMNKHMSKTHCHTDVWTSGVFYHVAFSGGC